MPDIAYVCLSDLHLGAENSLLTALTPGSTEPDPQRASPLLQALMDCLRDLIRLNDGGRKPTLVLAGDLLELDLSTDNIAAMAFDRFLELAFPPGDELFDATILFVPGNHDHHLWETARERQYACFVESTDLDERLPVQWHATRMLAECDRRPVEATLLTTLMRRHPHLRAGQVRAVYPNLAIADQARRRCVVIHHGHFLEPACLLMSSLKDVAFPSRPSRPDVWDWEAENFAWMDFVWSALGRSGEVGRDVGLVYAGLRDDQAMERLAQNISHGITERLKGLWITRWIKGIVIRYLIGQAIDALRTLERARPEALSAAASEHLHHYLEGPLRRQLAGEVGHIPDEVTFAFGHTHKPFESRLSFVGYPHPVRVCNLGGWVVDSIGAAPVAGASVMLVSHDLNVASLRLFNQAPDGSASAPHLSAAEGDDIHTNALLARLASAIDLRSPPWSDFARVAGEAVQQRHAAMGAVVAELKASLGLP